MGRYSEEALEKGRKSNEEKFVRDARAKFGEKFDYSAVQYVRQKVPVEIRCPEHGLFNQTPDKHLQSQFGCPKCGVGVRALKKNDNGRQKFEEFFAGKFAESLELLTPYRFARQPVTLKCKRHGTIFEAVPFSIVRAVHACPDCAHEAIGLSSRLDHYEFVKRAIDRFGDQFDLSEAEYRTANDPTKIICPLHGEFKTKPLNFLNSSHGCPKCGRLHAGYAAERIRKIEAGEVKPRVTRLALMRVEVFGISAYKLGITSRRLLDRYAFSLREVVFETTLDELNALKLEQQLHGKYFKARDVRIFLAGLRAGKRWPGDSEIYKKEFIPAILEDLKEAVALIATDPNYWQSQPKLEAPILRIRSVRKVAGAWNPPKQVIRVDTKEVFDSASAAARAIGSTQPLVCMVCRGDRGHTKGIKLAWLSDYEAGKLPEFINMNRGGNHKNAKAVRCIDTGVVYATSIEAAQATGAQASKITSVCRGKRKAAGGCRWEYAV